MKLRPKLVYQKSMLRVEVYLFRVTEIFFGK